MWTQYYKQYNEENDELLYYLVSDDITLAIAIGQGDNADCCSITTFPFPATYLEESIEKIEFQSIYKIAVKKIRKRYGLD